MLFQDFISQFPPSNTGEFTEKHGDVLKVTWKMYQKISLEETSLHLTESKPLTQFTNKHRHSLTTTHFLKKSQKHRAKLIPSHAQLEINLKSLSITFSYYTENKSLKVGKAIIDDNDEVQFIDGDSQKLLPSFLEKVSYWFEDIKNKPAN